MLQKARCIAVLVVALGATCLYAADDQQVTLEGTLVSSACYLGGPSHPTGNDMGGRKGCGTYCLQKGDPAGLLTKENDFHVLVVSSIKLAPYVGQRLRVTGTDHNGAILVKEAEIGKNGNWEQIPLSSKR